MEWPPWIADAWGMLTLHRMEWSPVVLVTLCLIGLAFLPLQGSGEVSSPVARTSQAREVERLEGVSSIVSSSSTVSIQLLSPFNYAVIPAGTLVSLDVAGTGFDSVRFFLDGGPANPLSPPYELDTSSWTTGTHLVSVEALSAGVVVAEDTFVFFVDPSAVWPMDEVPVDVVLIGFDLDPVEIAGRLRTAYDRTIQLTPEPTSLHTFELRFQFTVRAAEPSYHESLLSHLRATGVYRDDFQARLNLSALQEQYTDRVPRDIFDPLMGYELDAAHLSQFLRSFPPVPPSTSAGFTFFLMNLSALDDPSVGTDHWFVQPVRDPDTGRIQDWWRLEWDNELNTPMGFPLNSFGGPDRVVYVDPTAYQWYLDWTWIWWRGGSGRAPYGYEYEEIPPDLRADYLAGILNDLVAGLAATLPAAPPVEPRIEVRNYVLSGSVAHPVNNLTWTVSADLFADYLRTFLPFKGWEVNTTFESIENMPRLKEVVDSNTSYRGSWGYIDGLVVWSYLDENRDVYVPDEPDVFEILTVNFLYDNRSMVFGGYEYTGLGGSGVTAIFLSTDRLFYANGTRQKGLTSLISHETGHSLGYGHQFGPNYRADFIEGNMGYFPSELGYGLFWEDALLRVYVREKLLRILALLDTREPLDLRPEFESFYANYRSLDFHRAYDDLSGIEGMLTDRVPPTADAGPDQTTYVGRPVVIDGSGSTDNYRILTYTWDFGDGTKATGTSPTTEKAWSEAGEYTVVLLVSDAGGNTAMDTAIVRVESIVPPKVLIQSPGASEVLATPDVTVRWNLVPGTDPLERVELRLDEGALVTLPPTETSYTFVSVPDGPHEVNITAYDSFGRLGSALAAFTVDTTRPIVSIAQPNEGDVVSVSEVLVRWSVAEAGAGLDRIELQADTGPVTVLEATASSYALFGLAEGYHLVSVSAIDQAGNAGRAYANFTVDTVPPVVTIVSPASGSYFGLGSTIRIEWMASDLTSGIEGFELVLDGGPPISVPPGEKQYALGDLADGSHVVLVRAIDRADLMSEATTAFTLDRAPPVLVILSPVAGFQTASDEVEVRWSASDETSGLAQIEIRLDDNPSVFLPGSATSHVFSDLSVGPHEVRITAVDRAGNPLEVTVDFTVLPPGPSPVLPLDVRVVLGLLGVAGTVVAVVLLLARRRGGSRKPPVP